MRTVKTVILKPKCSCNAQRDTVLRKEGTKTWFCVHCDAPVLSFQTPWGVKVRLPHRGLREVANAV